MTTKRRNLRRRWRDQRQRDPYVKRALTEGYRSRAAYKLLELDRRDRLLAPGMVVVDLGAAPGGWSQYAAERVGKRGIVVAVDLLPMDPVAGVAFIRGDFTQPEVAGEIVARLAGRGADLVISDMSPNISGMASIDQPRSLALARQAVAFAFKLLKPDCNMVIKVFQGENLKGLQRCVSVNFAQCLMRKPGASRSHSRETYLVAKGFTHPGAQR